MAEYGLGRREALLALAAGVAGLPAGARAEAGRVVIGTWGGDYAALLDKNIEAPILKPLGFEVVQDQASDSPRRAKMTAEKRLPRGTTDVQALSAAGMFEMQEAGVLLTLDYSQIPNAKNLLPTMKYPYGVGHIYSGNTVVYNPKMVSPAPVGFKDMFDPKHGSKLGLIDIQYQIVMISAALAAGGGVTDIEKGKPLLMAVKAAGARIYPTNEAFAQGLKAEEVSVGMIWKARVVQWQNAGIPVESVAPAEGLPMYVSGFCIPRNAPNKAGAYAYLNAMLEKSAQEAFAVDMGYNATVNNAAVAPDLLKRIGFTPDEQKRLVDMDYAYLAKNDAAMKDWWDKVFKA